MLARTEDCEFGIHEPIRPTMVVLSTLISNLGWHALRGRALGGVHPT